MDIDALIAKTFGNAVAKVPNRMPGDEEVASALGPRPVWKPGGNSLAARLADLAPVLALAAASLALLLSPPERIEVMRPLAARLSAGASAEAIAEFQDYLLEIGESYRSRKGR